MVVQGSSHWILGRNITRVSNIVQIGGSALELPNLVPADFVTMIDHEGNSHVLISRFVSLQRGYVLQADTASSGAINSRSPSIEEIPSLLNREKTMSQSQVRHTVNCVHRHACGHATYSDLRTLLIRNNLWSLHVQHYLTEVVSSHAAINEVNEANTITEGDFLN